MRDLIIDRIKPVVQRVAEDLADLVVAKLEQHLLVVRDSLEVAVSAVASELAGDASDLSAWQPPEAPDVSDAVLSRMNSPASTVPEQTPSTKPPRRCKTCREVGHRADRCPTVNKILEFIGVPAPAPEPVTVVNDEEDDAPAPRVTRARSPFVSIPPLLASRIASPRSKRGSRHARRTRTAPSSWRRTAPGRVPSILTTSPS